MTSSFDKDYSSTVGIDFFAKPIQIRDHTVDLQIWDTAGQERFKSLIPSYIRDSNIAVIVYDVSDPNTFEEAKVWHKTVISERGNDAICIFVGNKNDLESKVLHEKVTEFTKPLSIQTIETSAKTGQNVTRLFKLICESIPDISRPQSDPIVVVDDAKVPANSNQCSC
ncbi:ras-related protein Rab-6B [Histomonas meleagridis]|uniref:ras-related protein Rab-6B n=1 Tax=Histomonas meleagridis TaxID=135588 RepID=UPI00355ABC85|nr:ras-related protein Rab-6B [Histomonas meleagridis]KAH0796468.1 ras-related protein Rab-6B [Histomonas meleagridis]